MPSKIPYNNLRDLIRNELKDKREDAAADLLARLRHVKKDKVMSREEFLAVCKWKSPRPVRFYGANTDKQIQQTIRSVLSTRSERLKLTLLSQLRGVSIPMASAILTVIDPQHYGVIDIRVWQVLYAVKAVRKKPGGQGFTFNNWFQYLMKVRYFASEFRVSVRAIELTLFECHRKFQAGNLYPSTKLKYPSTKLKSRPHAAHLATKVA